VQQVMEVMLVERCSERGSGRGSWVHNPSKVNKALCTLDAGLI